MAKISEILGIVVTDKTGFVASDASLSATDIPTPVLDCSISDTRLEDHDMKITEQTSNPKIDDAVVYDYAPRQVKRYSVTRVLDTFRGMGCTDDEIAYERVMMYADPAYRRFWTKGDWIM